MDIYVQKNGHQTGPYSEEQLLAGIGAGEIQPQDLAWREGQEAWSPLETLIDLKTESTPPTAAPPPMDKVRIPPSFVPPTDKQANPVNPPGFVRGSTASQGTRVFEYVQHVLKNRQAAEIISDFKAMDLKAEVLPFDEHSFKLICSDFVFWSVALLAVIPLILITLSNPQMQMTGLFLFFAMIWGMIFKQFILEDKGGWKAPIVSLLFTGLIGVNALLWIYKWLPQSYMTLISSENVSVKLAGYVFQVGFCEELCKILPVAIYLIRRKSEANPFTVVLLGVFSGLGFAAFENMLYANGQIQQTAAWAKNGGEEGLQAGVMQAMITVMCRPMSCVFGHAVYTGIFSYFLAVGVFAKRRIVALAVVGLCVASTVHGLYDWFWGVQIVAPAIVSVGAFMLFYTYLTKLRLMIESADAGIIISPSDVAETTPADASPTPREKTP